MNEKNNQITMETFLNESTDCEISHGLYEGFINYLEIMEVANEERNVSIPSIFRKDKSMMAKFRKGIDNLVNDIKENKDDCITHAVNKHDEEIKAFGYIINSSSNKNKVSYMDKENLLIKYILDTINKSTNDIILQTLSTTKTNEEGDPRLIITHKYDSTLGKRYVNNVLNDSDLNTIRVVVDFKGYNKKAVPKYEFITAYPVSENERNLFASKIYR